MTNRPIDVFRRLSNTDQLDACWEFQGSTTTKGYGSFYFDGRTHVAHRLTYELLRGPIAPGLQLDHLCRNRRCCNPNHLEPVTCLENIQRSPLHNGARTHCPQGHPYAGENLRLYRGGRYCRQCIRDDSRERKQRNRARLKARSGGAGCPGTAGL